MDTINCPLVLECIFAHLRPLARVRAKHAARFFYQLDREKAYQELRLLCGITVNDQIEKCFQNEWISALILIDKIRGLNRDNIFSKACEDGKRDIAELYISLDTRTLRTKFLLACEHGQYEIVELLIDKGNAICWWDDGIIRAHRMDHRTIIELIITKALNPLTSARWNKLFEVACRKRCCTIVELLVAKGSKIDGLIDWNDCRKLALETGYIVHAKLMIHLEKNDFPNGNK